MPFIVRRFVAGLVAWSILVASVLFASANTHKEVLTPYSPVASVMDCTSEIISLGTAFVTRSAATTYKAMTAADKWNAAQMAQGFLVPGLDCGRWLGRLNVAQICWFSRQAWWVPGALYDRGLIWATTGGRISQC